MSDISRRKFLQIAGGAALGTLTAQMWLGQLKPAQAVGKSVSRTTGSFRRAIPSVCLQCPANCSILGFLEDGILRKIEGNPLDPNSHGKLCAKGLAGINHAYSPDRLLFPIKRVGARGEGKWKRITWPEAINELENRLQAIRNQGKPEEFHFIAGLLEGVSGLTGRFLQAYGTPSVTAEMDLYQSNKKAAQQVTWGVDTEIPNVANSRFILNFGANPYEFHPMFIPLAQRLKQAQLKGAKLVTFDPRLSFTAAQSNIWLQPNPGTDAVVALAMANVIMKQGLANSEFLDRWTNYSSEKLARHLEQYTPQSAEIISGIPAIEIVDLAVELASSNSSIVIAGDGVSQHSNGVQNERAIALLNAVIGNIDSPGGVCLPRRYEIMQPEPQPPKLTFKDSFLNLTGNINPDPKVSLLLTYMANPVYSSPVPNEITQSLKDERRVPYFVAMDTYLTETAMLADMVLPAATYLESYNLQSPPAYDLVPFINLMQPVIPLQGESLSGGELFLELGKRMGGDVAKYFAFSSVEDYWKTIAGTFPGLIKDGGWDALKAKGVWSDWGATPVFYSYKKQGFNTPSGKYEIYSQTLEKQQLAALPAYTPLPSAPGKEFQLITFQFNTHTYGRTAPCMWLSEITHTNPVWINKGTAGSLGIHNGDQVRLTSAAGVIVVKAMVTESVKPGVLAIGSCVGHWGSGRIAQGKAYESENPNTKLLWWEEHGNGVHPHHIIPWSKDPIAGGQGWKDTLVSISKV
ncbi:MAG: thiosulfate reductase [Dehalococcoidia bacterium]|nr:thiosulfate reductase [Dehalococcoidia bacterium]MBF8304004.1 thiosulfate reductase [Dehalococcoidia bacterium]